MRLKDAKSNENNLKKKLFLIVKKQENIKRKRAIHICGYRGMTVAT
jgi:hypothetical protein